jgi:hypothetical protein
MQRHVWGYFRTCLGATGARSVVEQRQGKGRGGGGDQWRWGLQLMGHGWDCEKEEIPHLLCPKAAPTTKQPRERLDTRVLIGRGHRITG